MSTAELGPGRPCDRSARPDRQRRKQRTHAHTMSMTSSMRAEADAAAARSVFLIGDIGETDTIGTRPMVLLIDLHGERHVLTNQANSFFETVVEDDVMEELRRAHATAEFHMSGDALFSRKWKGRIYTWSRRNQQWQAAKAYTEAREELARGV